MAKVIEFPLKRRAPKVEAPRELNEADRQRDAELQERMDFLMSIYGTQLSKGTAHQ